MVDITSKLSVPFMKSYAFVASRDGQILCLKKLVAIWVPGMNIYYFSKYFLNVAALEDCIIMQDGLA